MSSMKFETLDEIERDVILRRLKHFPRNRAGCAESLGIASRTLAKKLKRYEVQDRMTQGDRDGIKKNATTTATS